MNIREYALRAGEDRMLYLEKVRDFAQTDDICCSDIKVAADLFRDMYQMHRLPEEYVYNHPSGDDEDRELLRCIIRVMYSIYLAFQYQK